MSEVYIAMIIDCHTHIWDVEKHLGSEMITDYMRVWGGSIDSLKSTPEIHMDAMSKIDRAVVLAFKSLFFGINVPNEFVAEYVNRDPKKFIGFCSVDPNHPDAVSELPCGLIPGLFRLSSLPFGYSCDVFGSHLRFLISFRLKAYCHASTPLP
jgi:hypothetical protein